jgi:hypothetical protein
MADDAAARLRVILGRVAQWWERGEFDQIAQAEAMIRTYVSDIESEIGEPMGVVVEQRELHDSWRVDILAGGKVVASESFSLYPSGVPIAKAGPRSLEDSVQAICRAIDRLGWMVDRYEFERGMDGETNLVIHAQRMRDVRKQ